MKSFSATAGHNSFYRQSSPLSDDQIRKVAPSVFASEAHESRSARYTYIPTLDVVAGLRKEGFEPFAVMQGRSRVPGKAEFTKHLLRFRHATQTVDGRVGERMNEIVLINSHDGTSSYQMMAGIFELVCANGLVVCKETLDDVRIPHKGDIVHEVVGAAYKVLDGFDLIRDITHEAQALQLTRPEQEVFADAALHLKYEDDNEAPIAANQLLQPRRMADAGPSLWHTFNRVQENVIRGGLHGRTSTNRRISTREVTGIDSNVKLNKALWTLMEGMKALKQSA